MKRSISILLTLAAATVCGLLAPVSARAQKETSGVIVKQDGDSIVLIPREPGKVFLVLGLPRDEKNQTPAVEPSGSRADHAGEQRISTKEYSKIYVLEVRQLTEVDLLLESSGLQVTEKTTGAAMSPTGKPCACDFPLPPRPRPQPMPLGFLIGGGAGG